MMHEMKEYDEFRVLLDRYDTKSLINYTRLDQTKRLSAVITKLYILQKIHTFKQSSSSLQLKQKMNQQNT